MTNGRGAAAGMASFMTKKKKYKFQVDVDVDELLEVPFVSAVLFVKLRLLDGGSFQDVSTREEVKDHKVKWGAKFSFQCKMLANASTGVLERCVLRISIRKECKGGRSFTKLGFVDLNLAEYAGSGVSNKKALLEGYDTRHRQDNSMLKFSIAMNMLSGDILFKVPSPSLKHKVIATEESSTEPRPDEFSGGSIGGSIASGSSGFGSLPKKRPALLSSDLVIGHTLTENNVPVTIALDNNHQEHHQPMSSSSVPAVLPTGEHPEPSSNIHSNNNNNNNNNSVATSNTISGIAQTNSGETLGGSANAGHSRNSSNTSQLSKASGYSSIHSQHSHSRQSSSGDSGHIRGLSLHRPVRKPNNNGGASTFTRVNTYPNRARIPNTIMQEKEVYSTPLTSPIISMNPSISGALNKSPDQDKIVVEPAQKLNLGVTTPKQQQLLLPGQPNTDQSQYFTPTLNSSHLLTSQISQLSASSPEDFKTPETSMVGDPKIDVFSQNFVNLQKSASASLVMPVNSNHSNRALTRQEQQQQLVDLFELASTRLSLDDSAAKLREKKSTENQINTGVVLRSKSEFEIPRVSPTLTAKNSRGFGSSFFKSDTLSSLFTPILGRKSQTINNNNNNNNLLVPPTTTSGTLLSAGSLGNQSTPKSYQQQQPQKKLSPTASHFKIPHESDSSPPVLVRNHQNHLHSATSLNSLRSGNAGSSEGSQQSNVQGDTRVMSHRKLLEAASTGLGNHSNSGGGSTVGGKLGPLAVSPADETSTTQTGALLDASSSATASTNLIVANSTGCGGILCSSGDCCSSNSVHSVTSAAFRRPSITTNPSSSSLVLSETGSLDRAKAAYERRKKIQVQDNDTVGGVSGTASAAGTTANVPGRVEVTRVNPDHLIAELLKSTNLDQTDDSAESSGLQLFIAKDGTAALGNHEVKSQMSTGVQIFKQVVMDDNR